ncbi:hypothetical protein BC628DRAFT_766531 [Trametes gibbosa]|nr:hypothetical protein BC628DRAFT_766531 [Trametes gibbosa]
MKEKRRQRKGEAKSSRPKSACRPINLLEVPPRIARAYVQSPKHTRWQRTLNQSVSMVPLGVFPSPDVLLDACSSESDMQSKPRVLKSMARVSPLALAPGQSMRVSERSLTLQRKLWPFLNQTKCLHQARGTHSSDVLWRHLRAWATRPVATLGVCDGGAVLTESLCRDRPAHVPSLVSIWGSGVRFCSIIGSDLWTLLNVAGNEGAAWNLQLERGYYNGRLPQ